MIRQGSALVYIDDILLLSNSKPHKLQLVLKLHDIAIHQNLQLAPEKSSLMLLALKHLCHEISFNRI